MLSVSLKKRLGDLEVEACFGRQGPGVTALFGPSGSGKTSLVNMLAGLLTPDQGRVVLEGRVLFDSRAKINLPPERRRVGYVFQEGRLFPHLSVKGNLAYGQRLAPKGQAWASWNQVVELLGLEGLLERRPAKLSGGEKQRVAMGRALLASPRLLLLDEPLASLDAQRKDEVLGYLGRLTRHLAIPVIYVSHQPGEILRLADSVVRLERGRVLGIDDLEGFRRLLDSWPKERLWLS
ncbi:MAG: molybdenum ABC transporter ATP-binding protein [Proteobacteria bacterium]|nr:molybdenum ABC transporter ATP-binding protein [Pseudomonadota bacterium]MBU1449503.1 molybdenum ABC transporter ATP-binding protein [Pseudomonadota bacterium]MBU2467634.1 molybdenum ABC transporter ATP-binding protein [Pseudomonadota bacterium]MBU2516189.1 molybdenum ABC transporter ATP-binding protein [Pseudomonadota bacterium]